jgi:hypothetical protein
MFTKTAKLALVFLLLVSAGCMVTDTKIVDLGSDKTSQTFTLTLYGKIEWSVTSTEAWVTVNPNKGQAGGKHTIKVTVDRTGLDPGSYEATLIISNNLNTLSRQVLVKMTVEAEAPQKANLKIDTVGQGAVTSDVSGIDCGGDCSAGYTKGTTIVLTATETSSDYQFYSFSGCDSQTANTCTVTLDRDRIVFATFTREIVWNDNTKILDENIMHYFAKQEDSTYYFDPQVSNIIKITPGDILKSIVDKGFLRKVNAVRQTTDNLIAVETEQATIEDAASEGTIAFSKKLTHSDISSFNSSVKGVTLREPDDPDSTEFTFDLDNVPIKLPHKNANNVIGTEMEKDFEYGYLKGKITLNIEPDFAFDWCLFCSDPGIQKIRAVVNAQNHNELKLNVTKAVNFGNESTIRILPYLVLGQFVVADIV